MFIKKTIKEKIRYILVTLFFLSYIFLIKENEAVKNTTNNYLIIPFKERRTNYLGYVSAGNSKLNKENNGFMKFKNDKNFSLHNKKLNFRNGFNKKLAFELKESLQNNMNLSEKEYDVAIIGCGVGGHAAAINAMERNLKVLIFVGEEDCIGGTCVNVGCIPSKSLLYATNKYRELKNLDKLYNYGIYSNLFMNKGNNEMESNQLVANSFKMNTNKLKEYTQGVINKLRNGIAHGFKTPKFSKNSELVQVIYEYGELIDKNTIKSKKSGNKYKVKNIILATGSTPNIPANVEVDERSVFTSDQAVKLEGLKNYMSIIGMGIIGLEFADIYTALGSEVTFFEYSSELLPIIDSDVAKYFEKVFLKTKPVNYHLNTEVKYIKASKNNSPVIIGYSERNEKNYMSEVKELYVDSCLVATGRKPNTQNMGLENMKIQMNRGYVSVDEYLRVKKENNDIYDNIFCIGDANGKQMLAHTASYQALKVIDFIENKEKNKVNESSKNNLNKPILYKNIPSVCYTNPELAFIGLTEKEAKKKYPNNVGVEISYYKSNSKILCENNISLHGNKDNSYNKGQYNTTDNTNGMVKIIYKQDTKQILGMFIVGNYASVLIHEAMLAINLNLTAHDLSYMVHSHPTVSEVLDSAFKSISKIRTH
ncbi:dihydrolipoyl dehydrogenase, apicoplast, putative [Plasmodium gallinaceum]|uniref:Dihydrolipoyl dehydrogenase, apicoplast, putative n=1 Tax=Plasmodium gallinaceum TaxID=5849 RepID=A0A1J1GPE5_PLAGA|nr:dihydrolipoyl dehydrogenase, apicoplast, putative [Plasmodium gallinaceum]CRG93159.1 dihydrolipoyl dehydrogenase, apicoplast, putative [Plasmodium gallinaceum]